MVITNRMQPKVFWIVLGWVFLSSTASLAIQAYMCHALYEAYK